MQRKTPKQRAVACARRTSELTNCCCVAALVKAFCIDAADRPLAVVVCTLATTVVDDAARRRREAPTKVMAAVGRPVAVDSAATKAVTTGPWKDAAAMPVNVAVAVTCTVVTSVGAAVGGLEGAGVTPTMAIMAAFKFLKFTLGTRYVGGDMKMEI